MSHPPKSAPPSISPHRIELDIAILGGGFAGVYCAKRLKQKARAAGIDPRRIAIVSEQNYLVFQPMLAEVAGASLQPRHVINPLRRLLRDIRVFRGKVIDIDLEKKEVRVDTGAFSAGLILAYQELVVGLGAEIDLSRVPGMPEHALLMQNIGDAMILRATVIQRIEEANAEFRPEVRKRLLTFVVVGGGYSGVETAGEMLDLLRDTAKYYSNVSRDEIRVVLIHSRDRVLHTLSDSLGEYAGRKLSERGLELCLGERVKAVTASRVYLQSGGVIETATVVSTVGNAPNRVIRSLCDNQGVPHDHYWIKTDPFLRVEDKPSFWAAGDCATVPLHGSEGQRCPQTAQFAMRQGMLLADNLVQKLRGQELKPFTFTGLGELASIGHQSAVASIMGMQFSGFIAWFMWRTVYLSKLPGLDRKLRVMIDWTLDLFFPRDLNLLNPRYTRLFKQVHLEPGDRLFNQGEPAFSLYVVRSGQIDLVDDSGTVVRSLAEGEYFGERALVHGGGYRYNAMAVGATELVSLGGEVVLPFFESSRRFSRVLAKTTMQSSAEKEIASITDKLNADLLEQTVAEVMHRDPASLRDDATVRDALELFRHRRHGIYPVVDENDHLRFCLSREDFFDFLKREDVNQESKISGVIPIVLPVCESTVTVRQALEKMVRSGRQKCFVTDGPGGKLRGVLAIMDLLGEAAIREVK